jgi:hypothetical protein
MPYRGLAILPLLLASAPKQAASFSYAGVSLESDLTQVAARYPHSTPQGDYLRLEPQDVHDHISSIEVSGSGLARRVRIAFELQDAAGRARYPRCEEIEARLVAPFGAPKEIRRFSEEAALRADRVWRSDTEELVLLCFRMSEGLLLAEAVQITRRPQPPK